MKKNKLYNMIFPVYPMFISMFFPPLIFLILGGNFIIDSLLMLIISKICFKKISGMFYVKHIFAAWGLGFAADIIGAVVCFSMLFSGIVLETSVIIGFLIAVLFIFVLDFFITFNPALHKAYRLDFTQRLLSSLAFAVFTAPITFFLPDSFGDVFWRDTANTIINNIEQFFRMIGG